MNAYGAELWGAPGSSRPNSQLRLRKTNWGFAVTDTSNRIHGNAMEAGLKTMGLLLIPLGATLVFYPGTASSEPMLISGRLGLAIAHRGDRAAVADRRRGGDGDVEGAEAWQESTHYRLLGVIP